MKSNCINIADSSPNEKTFSSLSAKSVRCGAGRRVGAETEISVFLRHKTVDRRASILYNHSCSVNGAVAQLARAFGSYPKCHRFESSQRYHVRRSLIHSVFAGAAKTSYPQAPSSFPNRTPFAGLRFGRKHRPTPQGPLVKWLRHRPFTAVTWVRVPYGSPHLEA